MGDIARPTASRLGCLAQAVQQADARISGRARRFYSVLRAGRLVYRDDISKSAACIDGNTKIHTLSQSFHGRADGAYIYIRYVDMIFK
jgi:hypothetical protein